jgi:hypothetical protein
MNTYAIIGISIAVYLVWFGVWVSVLKTAKHETEKPVKDWIFVALGGPIAWVLGIVFLLWVILSWIVEDK